MTAIPLEIPEEALHHIIGSLGLDSARPLGRGDDQCRSEKLGSITIDLLDHLLQSGCPRILGASLDLPSEGLNGLLESGHFHGCPLLIQTSRAVDWSQAHRLA